MTSFLGFRKETFWNYNSLQNVRRRSTLQPKTLLHLVEGKFHDFRQQSEKFYLLILTDAKYQQLESEPLQTLGKFAQVVVDKKCIAGKLRYIFE